MGFLFGAFPAQYLVTKLRELYPIVELKLGPEYTQLEAKKRKKLYTVISAGVIPFVISLLIELVKIIIGQIGP